MRTGLTLREFCRAHGHDPGYLSKLERGRAHVIPTPLRNFLGVNFLDRLAVNLGLERSSGDWWRLFDLANAECGRIPHDLLSDDELVKHLPAFFPALRGCKDRGKALDAFVEMIRRA